MIDFTPSEDQQLLRDGVAQFAKATLAERVREIEVARAVPEDICAAAGELGLAGISLPEACGGQGQGLLTEVLLEEELGKIDAGAAAALPGPGAFGTAVVELAEAQAEAILAPVLEPGAFGAVAWGEKKPHPERPGMTTVAKRAGDGWTLTGAKHAVHNAALAKRLLVIAQVDEAAGWNGLGAFVVDAEHAQVGERHTTLGLDAAWFGTVSFADAPAQRIGPEDAGELTVALLRFFAKRGLIHAARATGLAQRAFDMAREHCDNRVAFGKPIGHFQAVAFTLADRLMDVESSRWQVWQAAWAWDEGKKDALMLSAQASAHALEAAMRCGDDCVSLHGGMGFIRDVEAEKLMRDAKQLALCGMTPAQHDQLAAALEVGAALDPALLLPTPEAQTIFI